MNRKLFGISFLISGALSLVSPVLAGASAPQATASCTQDYKLVINMTPPADHDHWAIRVDDRSNSFQPTKMRPGDVLIDDYALNTFSTNAQSAEMYNWWIHSVSRNGTWSDPVGGSVNCTPKAPAGLSASYDHPYVTLKWNPVKGAVRYAIRVDNTISGWDPEDRQAGDHFVDHVTETEFKFQAARDRKIVWWIHAVDKYGVWSDTTWSNFTTK